MSDGRRDVQHLIVPPFPDWLTEQARRLEEQLYEPSPWMKLLEDQTKKAEREIARRLEDQLYGGAVVDNHKEKTMTTRDQIAKVRAEQRSAEIKVALDEWTEFVKELDAVPGTVFIAEIKFPDNDTVYHYAFVFGSDKRWYKTYSTARWTTTELIDELVRLDVESERMSVE